MEKPIMDWEEASQEDLDSMKRWLFRENMRLTNLAKELQGEKEVVEAQQRILESQRRKNGILKKQLESQKMLFDQQWAIMEAELRRMAVEKEHMDHERAKIRDEAYREARKVLHIPVNVEVNFFRGVTDEGSLRKRYKELMKIYHPDNANGDKETILVINREYEKLKEKY
ncbi:MAG: hypothetical protein K6C69_00725 [Lachnospiraceae bacterium]|nr:hypothetical protein [Lachnospiraceae bacterium]